MSNITKLYAAYKAGYLGDNILDTYFSFIANIISESQLSVVEDNDIAAKFKERYSIELPLPFVRQVLGVGVQNKCFVEDHGKYSVVVEELQKYRFNDTSFNDMWDLLIEGFISYCKKVDIDITSLDLEKFVLGILDTSDERLLAGEKADDQKGLSPAEFAWYSFAKEQAEYSTDLYSFIAALSASNITKQALFYFGEGLADYSGLHVYLDSPIIFALLGMDEESRTESYKTLVSDMIKANCCVHILDHNFQEVDSILARAASWAKSTHYNMARANNAARFFHDTQMGDSEISEFCEGIETKLNELGITVKKTSYDVFQDKFQEDENCLFRMIQDRYQENGYELTDEKIRSIRIDVRSIIIIYRERQGQTATRLQSAGHILLTSNNAIANVSKLYESNQSTQAGHIPACVSADLFGSILWLNSPLQMLEYQKRKLLADCYAYLKPTKSLLNKYIQSLDDARNADEIDEKKYLFLRTHKVVLDSLMNVTKGDYARFNSKTYLEVFDDIQAKAMKRYNDEAAAHSITRNELKELHEKTEGEKKKSEEKIASLEQRVLEMETEEKKRKKEAFEKRVTLWGWAATIVLVGIPYFLLVICLEVLKTQFSDVSWRSVYGIAGTAIATIIAGTLFGIGKKTCFQKVRSILEKHK